MAFNLRSTAKRSAAVMASGLFILIGLFHFKNPDPFVAIVPDYLPWHLALVYISGVFEILGGIALLVPMTRQIGRWGLIALLVAVFPANINMAVNGIDMGLPHAILWWRLPFQLLFIAWVWWAGKD